MATAILIVYTKEGFFIAADGLKRTSDGKVVGTSAQKLFPIEGPTPSFAAYALAASVQLSPPGEDEEIVSDFIKEMEAATADAGSAPPNLQAYMEGIATRIRGSLRRTMDACPALKLPPTPGKGKPVNERLDTIAFVLFAGYFSGSPDFGYIRFVHEDQKLMEPQVTTCSLDIGKPNGYLSEAIAPALFYSEDPLFKRYRIFKRSPEDRTLADGLKMMASYFRACADSKIRVLDEDHCASVGGTIRAANITPRDGFKWIDRRRVNRAFQTLSL
jgi:hypothetical protein